MPTTATRISEFDTPVYSADDYSAEIMADELSHHYSALKRLNMAPATNAKQIAWHRAEISEILSALVAHFVC